VDLQLSVNKVLKLHMNIPFDHISFAGGAPSGPRGVELILVVLSTWMLAKVHF